MRCSTPSPRTAWSSAISPTRIAHSAWTFTSRCAAMWELKRHGIAMQRSQLDRRDPFAGGFGHPFADGAGRVIIVSNRLPMTASVRRDAVRLHRSCGGLASGLRGVQERSNGLWIGWSGVADCGAPHVRRRIDDQLAELGAVAVPFDEAEID